MGLMEEFIHMFLDEADRIARRGLRCGYEEVEGNEVFLKGRLKFPEHIRYKIRVLSSTRNGKCFTMRMTADIRKRIIMGLRWMICIRCLAII